MGLCKKENEGGWVCMYVLNEFQNYSFPLKLSTLFKHDQGGEERENPLGLVVDS